MGPSPRARAAATLLSGALGVVLVAAVLRLPREAGGLTRLVDQELPNAGATHAVTAVLLDFRAYDTFLEVGVLLLAAVGVLAIRRASDLGSYVALAAPDPILMGMARVAVPVMILTGGYLLWAGTHSPGGAFQAGALVAAAAILLLLAGGRGVMATGPRLLMAIQASAFATFLGVAWILLLAGRNLLDYPASIAGEIIVLIELAVAIAVAAGLASFVLVARRLGDGR